MALKWINASEYKRNWAAEMQPNWLVILNDNWDLDLSWHTIIANIVNNVTIDYIATDYTTWDNNIIIAKPYCWPININIGKKNIFYTIKNLERKVDIWESRESLPFATSGIFGCCIWDYIYIVDKDKHTLRYDIENDTWKQLSDSPVWYRRMAAWNYNNKLVIVSSNIPAIYDPNTDSWTTGSSWPQTWRVSGNIIWQYIYCYYHNNKLYRYDIENDTWEQLSDKPGSPQEGCDADVVNWKLYVVWWYDSDYSETPEV